MVLIIALCISVLRHLYLLHGERATAPVQPRLLDRIDCHDGSSVVRVTVRDHYVEVTLSGGATHRILMRFADAINEMVGCDGFCVHRSHWVARDHIQEVLRVKGREVLRTSDGAIIPIGPKYRENLVNAALLSP